jgi:hypothetical protein
MHGTEWFHFNGTEWFRTRVRFGKNEERNGSVPMFGSGKNAERNGKILVQLTSFMLMVNIPPPCNNIVTKNLAALCLYFQQFAITNIFI